MDWGGWETFSPQKPRSLSGYCWRLWLITLPGVDPTERFKPEKKNMRKLWKFLWNIPICPPPKSFCFCICCATALLGDGWGLYRECDTLGQHLTCWIRVWHCTITPEPTEIAGIDHIQPRKKGQLPAFLVSSALQCSMYFGPQNSLCCFHRADPPYEAQRALGLPGENPELAKMSLRSW